MPDLSFLNILIAMVIVILVLSLTVQSIQTLIKKVLKLKSRSILNSLEDLFETISHKPPAGQSSQSKTPQALVADVTNRLTEMGRKTIFGRPMLDSLAKGDLLKILTRVKAEDLLPGAVSNFQTVFSGIKELKDELGKIQTNLLQGEASAKFAAMQASIMPLIHDLEALAGGGNIDPAVFIGDLFKPRQIKAAEVLDILGQVQQAVSQDLATAQKASDESHKALAGAQQSKDEAQIKSAEESAAVATGKLEAVTAVDDGLKKIANQIARLSNAFDAAFAPLFARLEQVEVWYDTVMQGFEERYTRHMRTVALVISIGVVVILNANFFSVYRAMKAEPAKAKFIAEQIEKHPELLRRDDKGQTTEASTPAATATPSSTPSATPSQATSPNATASPATPAASATPSPSPSPPVTIADVKKDADKVSALVSTYESFGLKPLSPDQLSNFWTGNYTWGKFGDTILGWLIMIMLLSAGAPFWQDTLESLFGLKNMLRQKSGTKNVEDQKGGQPKP